MVQEKTLKLIFIVGVGRSGTSLLQSMFAAHPAVSCLPETSFLRRYAATRTLQSISRASGLRSVTTQLEMDALLSRTKLNVQELIQQASTDVGLLDIRIYRAMLNTISIESGPYVVDKDPRMIEFLPLLQAATPTARVINVIRDPRDVLASKKQAAWSKSGHVWKHIFANRIQLRLGREWGKKLFGGNYHEVVYEELISSPDRVLLALCERLGLSYDTSMLNFGEAAKRMVSLNEMSWKKETLGPLLGDNKGKWKGTLACKEVKLTEACCDEAMRIGNYVVDQDCAKLGLAERLWVLTGTILISIGTFPYLFYRKHTLKAACKQVS